MLIFAKCNRIRFKFYKFIGNIALILLFNKVLSNWDNLPNFAHNNLSSNMLLLLIVESILVFLFNLPFGYWRINVQKFSSQWILAIHIPVLFVIALRLYTDIGFSWYSYFFMILAFFLGQKLGGFINLKMGKICERVTSCLVMDLYRCKRNN